MNHHPHQREVTNYCSRNKKQLILGSDASAHHIISGSTDKKSTRRMLNRTYGKYKT
jgi:hypothetical protein